MKITIPPEPYIYEPKNTLSWITQLAAGNNKNQTILIIFLILNEDAEWGFIVQHQIYILWSLTVRSHQERVKLGYFQVHTMN